MESNIGQFLLQLDAMKLKLKSIPDEVARRSFIILMDKIISETPIDETDPDDVTARGDWNAEAGSEPSEVHRNDRSGEAAKAAVRAAAASWKPSEGESVFASLYSEYAQMLEYGQYPSPSKTGRTVGGFSSQAVAGFVRVNALTWDTIVASEARKYLAGA